MVYTEIKEVSGKKYYYRVKSVRKGGKVAKERKYLGVDLEKKKLVDAEKEADKELMLLENLLTKKEEELLERIKTDYIKEPKETSNNRYEAFCSLFTHHSTAIEGNTLTLQETASLLFEGRAPQGKSLREINEVLNHREAFDYILKYKGDINKQLMLEIHKLIAKNTLREDVKSQLGKFREVQVYIRGTEWLPPKPEEIAKEVGSLLSWYSKNKKKLHPLILAAYFHTAFETIHPFVDGNGRTGRMLMNLILRKNNYPMINIPNKERDNYFKALEEAQVKGNLRPFIEFLIKILQIAEIRF